MINTFQVYNRLFWWTLALSLAFLSVDAQTVFIDEDFSEWTDVEFIHIDKSGDMGQSGVDFQAFKAAQDNDFIYFYLEIGRISNLDAGNNITLYIDIDNNSTTGFLRNGIGAELRYNFGSRSGNFYLPTRTFNLGHIDIGLFFSPTITAERFEMVLKRKFTLSGVPISIDGDIKIVWEDMIPGGDALPDHQGGLLYSLHSNQPFIEKSFEIKKTNPEYIRVLSYNVERDAIFKPNNQAHFRRIIQALDPDIIGFQEIYDNNTASTRALIESFLPNSTWYAAGVFPDIKLISKYPIQRSSSLDGNGVFLLDLGAFKALVVVAHLPCCENDSGRQKEIDRIMGFVRDSKNGLTDYNITYKDAIIIMGDMNFVGDRQQVKTLISGEIVNKNLYGTSFTPDWDESDLEDTKAYTTGLPTVFTWYSQSSNFSPGRLDYIVYTGSNLQLENAFGLFTSTLSNQLLEAHGLLSKDVLSASDHIPVVADFRYKLNTTSNKLISTTASGQTLKIFPNPALDVINVNLPDINEDPVKIEIINTLGSISKDFYLSDKAKHFEINISDLPEGMYILHLYHSNTRISSKFSKF